MMECIFCKIIDGSIPSKKIVETEKVLAFYDIEPQAPFHAVIIPKEHIVSMNDINSSNSAIMSELFMAVASIARLLKLDNGYRVVCNCGEDAGQSVGHLHLHMLAGRSLKWPPG